MIKSIFLNKRYWLFSLLFVFYLFSTVSCQGCDDFRTFVFGEEPVYSTTNEYHIVEQFPTDPIGQPSNPITVDINQALSISTTLLYEHENDKGEIKGEIVIDLPDGILPSSLLSELIKNNNQNTSFVIGNQIGEFNPIDITITNLPTGLNLQLDFIIDENDDEISSIKVKILDNAVSHKKTDNVEDISVYFSEDLFLDNPSALNKFANDIILTFDIIFGAKAILPRWSPRHEHQAFIHNNEIWVLGGNTMSTTDDAGRINDIWKSSNNGSNWQVVVGNASWNRRASHQSFVYNNNLYVLGGRGHTSSTDWISNAWSSGDNGETWTEIINNAPWSGRLEHQAVVDNNDNILILGGLSVNGNASFGRRVNDIWTSANGGTTWSIVTSSANWSHRARHQVVNTGNKLWVLGGSALTGTISSTTNDVFLSIDSGTNWALRTTDASWAPRENHQAFFHDNKLWVIGGSGYNDVWYSTDDGSSWQSATQNAEWSGRESHQAFAYGGKLWVIGGRGEVGNSTIYNDIWVSTNGGTNWYDIPLAEGVFSYE